MTKKTTSNKTESLKRFSTLSDMEIDPLYTRDSINNIDYDRDIGLPGKFPYTRGIHPTMYRGKLWTMRQFSGFATAKESNKRYKLLLKSGQTGLSVAFHDPTLMGYDSDNPMSRGEVGKCGVAIDSLKDMETLFEGIPLESITTSMTTNAPAPIIYSMYLAVAEKQGADLKKLSGTIQNDILKEYIAQKTWIFPPAPSMRLITDIFQYASIHTPKWNTISVSGYHIREAGSTAVQELAFTLADGIAYIEAGIKAGLDVDEFAPRISYFFNAHSDFFEEIAKYRAARRMWAKIMRDRFKAKTEKSLLLRFHSQTAGCSLTAQQPYNNIVRVTLQALSAVLGGTQSLHTNSMDETLSLPTEEAVKIALRTQQIIAHESGITNTTDPFGGSYFVENLTSRMEKDAFEYIHKIDEMGGMVKAIEVGFPQKEIANAAYHYQKQLESGEKYIVGINKYVNEKEKQHPILYISDKIEKEQIRNLKKLRKSRNNKKVSEALQTLQEKARTKENLIPFIMHAVKHYCTLGEICDCLRSVFGKYKDPGYY